MSTSRSDPGGGVVGFAIVFLTFVLSAMGLAIPLPVYLLLIAVGTVLALRSAGLSGFGLAALVLGALIFAMPLVTRLVFAAQAHAPDLEEPVPVPSGYGFKLLPGATNLEHRYDSQPIPTDRAEFAAVEVIDSYVNRLAPEWTVVSRGETPQNLGVELRQGDTSRGIEISVSAVMPEGRPAVLLLGIRTLLCGEDGPGLAPGEVGCWGAPVGRLVSYPDGGPVSHTAEPSTGPLREPVPLPPDYGFVLNPGSSSEQVHEYQSTVHISFREADRARRSVMRYYARALDDWTVVQRDTANLLVKDPDSTDGLAINVTGSGMNGGMVVSLEIRAITCQTDYWCNWSPVGG